MECATPMFLSRFVHCLSLEAGSSFIQLWPFYRSSACPTNGGKRYGERRFGSVCGRLGPSYNDRAADGTAGLAGHKVRALVRGEAASSPSEPARSADNRPGIHMAKTIAVVA